MDLGENKNWAEQTALSFDAVEKAYGEFCLGPLTLKLPAGCVTGLVGENGAGKTTLMKLALGMVIPEPYRAWILIRSEKENRRGRMWELSLENFRFQEILRLRWQEISGRGFMRTSTGITLRGFRNALQFLETSRSAGFLPE